MGNGNQKERHTGRRQPSQARSRATVEAILSTATRILREEGPQALNTNRVAEEVGISIGTLYGYFRNKQEIVVMLAQQLLTDDLEAFKGALNVTGSETIRALVKALLSRHGTDLKLRQAVIAIHVAEGYKSEHVEIVNVFFEMLLRHPDFGTLPPARLMMAVQATLGIARSLADGAFSSFQLSSDELEDELVALVEGILQWKWARGNISE